MSLSFVKNDALAELALPAGSNPFATRYTRPNAGEFLFPAAADAETLVARLRDCGWRGQITGPHGSGKSTLVHTLLPRLRTARRRVEFYLLRAPSTPWRDSIASWNAATQIVIDGGEQLGWLQRTWFQWQCSRRGAGLLVTAHGDLGLPQLYRTETSVELTQRIVARLLGEADAEWLRPEHVERLLAEHRGNVREVLFALYDLYEQRQAGGAAAASR